MGSIVRYPTPRTAAELLQEERKSKRKLYLRPELSFPDLSPLAKIRLLKQGLLAKTNCQL